MSEKKKIDCLIIMGMHRSGLSLVGRCFQLLGVNSSVNYNDDIYYSGSGSEGYNEAVLINDVLLRDIGCHWDMVGSLPTDWINTEAALTAKGKITKLIQRRFQDKTIWAIQDPRLCRFMPLWESVLQENGLNPGFIIGLRHPLEVARSLQKRDGFDMNKGLLLWLSSNREALDYVRNRPHAIVTYDQMLADPISSLKDIKFNLGFEYPLPIETQYHRVVENVRPELKHHHPNSQNEDGTGNERFDQFSWLYDQVTATQAIEKLSARSNENHTPDLLGGNDSKTYFDARNLVFPGTEYIPHKDDQKQLVQQGNKIFENYTELIGIYERNLHHSQVEKENRILRSTKLTDTLYARFHFISKESGSNDVNFSKKFLLPSNEWYLISLPIPNINLLRKNHLCIYPLNTRGMVYISAIKIVDISKNKLCWSATSSQDMNQIGIKNSFRLPLGESLSLLAYGKNAQILLPTIPSLPDCPIEIQVWIKADTNLELLASAWSKEQQIKETFIQKISEHENALKELENRKTKYAAKAERHQIRIAELEDTLTKSRALEQDLENQSAASAAETEKHQMHIAELESELTKSRALEQELKNQSAASAEATEQHQMRIAELESELNKSRELEQELKNQSATSAAATEQHQMRIAELESELNKSRELEQELKNQSATSAAATEQHQMRIAELESELNKIRELEQELKNQSATSAAATEQHQMRIAELESELNKIRELEQELKNQSAASAAETEKHQRRITELESELTKSRELEQELKNQSAASVAETEKHQMRITELESEVTKSRDQERDLENEVAESAIWLEKYQARIDELQSELSKSQALVQNLENQVADSSAELAKQRERINDLQSELSKHQAVQHGRSQELQTELSHSRSQQQKLRKRLAELDQKQKRQNNTKADLIQNYKQRHQLLENEFQTAQSRITDLIDEKNKLGRKVFELSSMGVLRNTYNVIRRRIRSRRYYFWALRHWRLKKLITKSSLFDSQWYFTTYPDVAESGINPLMHYFKYGALEGRDPNPHFNSDWYLNTYPDIAESKSNPLMHYICFGVTEGRDPNPYFDTDWYLEANPDVAESGINPLAHYLHFGESEGRNPRPFFEDEGAYAADMELRRPTADFQTAKVKRSAGEIHHKVKTAKDSLPGIRNTKKQTTTELKFKGKTPATGLNVLFVLYEALSCNSGYQVLHYAKRLTSNELNCILAVPYRTPEDRELQVDRHFQICTFEEIEKAGPGFHNGRGPDIVHAWTPREKVRRFCFELANKHKFKTIIHLEDNEEYLTEIKIGHPWSDLINMNGTALDKQVTTDCYHPEHGEHWLKKADGLTMIIDTLNQFNQGQLPAIVLPAPMDERLFYPQPLNYSLRNRLGIPDYHTVLVYTGNSHAGNQEEIEYLYDAVGMLNQRGCPASLICAGRNHAIRDSGEGKKSEFVKTLGWVKHSQIPEILSAADVLVQPGVPGAFNDYRVPGKLPEYFAIGRPVVLPRTNWGLEIEHMQEGYVLDKADAEHITQAVMEITKNKELAGNLAAGGVSFGKRKSEEKTDDDIVRFYHEIIKTKR